MPESTAPVLAIYDRETGNLKRTIPTSESTPHLWVLDKPYSQSDDEVAYIAIPNPGDSSA